jgi:hypothetical protein
MPFPNRIVEKLYTIPRLYPVALRELIAIGLDDRLVQDRRVSSCMRERNLLCFVGRRQKTMHLNSSQIRHDSCHS